MTRPVRLRRLLAAAFELHLAMRERFKRRLGDHASFPRLAILHCVTGRASLPMKDVAACLGVTPPTVSSLVDALVADGYVTRVSDPKDRRGVRLRLTLKGRQQLRAGFARMNDQLAEVFDRLTDAEQDQLTTILKKLLV